MKKIFLFTALFCATLMAHAQYTPTAEELNEILQRIENKLTNIENYLNIPNGESNFPQTPTNAIVPNPTEVVVHATSDATKEWDTMFFIKANRALSAGENTIVEFDYYTDGKQAEVQTQSHGEPGEYSFYSALGPLTFKSESQHFSDTFIIQPSADGMKTIAFLMSVLKEDCNYHIKNVIWKTADGKESLIDQTGTANFFVKEGADASISSYDADPVAPNPTEMLIKTKDLDENADNWTNTLTINLKRALAAGEKLKFSFDYSCSSPSSTDNINGAEAFIGYYNAEYSILGTSLFTFTPTEQHFEQTITPNAAGLRQIVFCLSYYKGACNYTIKNVCVYVEGTQDLLIDEQGKRNFVVSSSAQEADKPTVVYSPGVDGNIYKFESKESLGYVSEDIEQSLTITDEGYLHFENAAEISTDTPFYFSPFPLINTMKGKTYILRYKMRGTPDQTLFVALGGDTKTITFNSKDWQEGELQFNTNSSSEESLTFDAFRFIGTFDIQYLEFMHQ